MKAYRIDGRGFLIEEVDCENDMPADCVAVAPPSARRGRALCWNGMEWLQIPLQNQDRKEARLRDARNAMLAESDWTQLADVPKAIKDKWKGYRQKLRDITEQMGWPDSVDWPTPPKP